MKQELFVCQCHSLEHQFVILQDPDDSELYIEIHLSTGRNFWKRLWYGLKYAFGYKCRFGAWDEIMLKPEDLPRLNKLLKTLEHNPVQS